MKILSIGNSFSQDAHKWLHEIASNHGMELHSSHGQLPVGVFRPPRTAGLTKSSLQLIVFMCNRTNT